MTVSLFITTGGGPSECRYALSTYIDIIRRAAGKEGCEAEVTTSFEGDRHGPKSVIMSIEGVSEKTLADSFTGPLKLVMTKNHIRPNHGRKNWFLQSFQIDIPSAEAPALNEADVEFETFQAGGPGGQHQNKTESAVRARHIPTGVTAVSRNQRSQHQNKKEALRMLAQVLDMKAKADADRSKQSIFSLSKDIERGNAVHTVKI